MRSYRVLPALASLLVAVSAGDINNLKEATAIQNAAVSFDTGNYIITNVATGKQIYLERDSTVGAYLGSTSTGVRLETASYGDVTGVVISGTDSATQKCLAAQWNFATGSGGARDEYVVPYSCVVGTFSSTDGGTDSTKELWLFNEAGSLASSSEASSSSAAAVSSSSAAKVAQENFAVVSASSASVAAAAADAATTTAAAVADAVNTSENAPAPVNTQRVDSHNQYTWDCQHNGWWLNRHYTDYIVTLNHVECIATWKAWVAATGTSTRRMVKRNRHAEIARSLEKRGTTYRIIASNHLEDMTTVALAGVKTTGYDSTPAIELQIQDDSSQSQLWTVDAL